MGRWLLLLGGPLIWAAHFMIIYAIASVSEQIAGGAGVLARALILVAGGAGVAAALFVLAAARRFDAEDPLQRFWRMVSAAGAILAIIAMLWQTLPALAPI